MSRPEIGCQVFSPTVDLGALFGGGVVAEFNLSAADFNAQVEVGDFIEMFGVHGCRHGGAVHFRYVVEHSPANCVVGFED